MMLMNDLRLSHLKVDDLMSGRQHFTGLLPILCLLQSFNPLFGDVS